MKRFAVIGMDITDETGNQTFGAIAALSTAALVYTDAGASMSSSAVNLANIIHGTNYDDSNIVKDAFVITADKINQGAGTNINGGFVYDLSKLGLSGFLFKKDIGEFILESKTLPNITIFTGKSAINSIGIYFDGKNFVQDITEQNKHSEGGK